MNTTSYVAQPLFSKLVPICLFAIVAATWGTTWMAMRIAVTTIPPVFATGLRFLFAAPLMLFITRARGLPLLFPPGHRRFQVWVGVGYFAVPFSLMIYGEQYVSSGLAALVFANMPVAVFAGSAVFLGERITMPKIAGLLISLSALAFIVVRELGVGMENGLRGICALIIAVLMHALIYTQAKKRGCVVSVFTFNVLPCALASFLLLGFGWLLEQPAVSSFSISSLCAVAYLGMFAGTCGILSYFALQQCTSAFRASLVFIVFPVVAVAIEALYTGRTVSPVSLVMIAPLVVGIFIIARCRVA